MIIIQILGWIFLPVYIASGEMFLFLFMFIKQIYIYSYVIMHEKYSK